MKIAILGSHPASVQRAPFMDATHDAYLAGKPQLYPPSEFINEKWHIWACSPGAFGLSPKADAWFEVHRWEPGQQWFSPEYCQFLREFRGPVYTGAVIPEIPNHVVYPRKRVEAAFSSYFLTSSLSLMAGLGILVIEAIRELRALREQINAEKAAGVPEPLNQVEHQAASWLRHMGIPQETITEELGKTDDDDIIGWWGVDMSANEEYSRQKPGAWFFGLEILRRGIGLYYPPESDLFYPEPIYGLCEWDAPYIKQTTRMRQFNQQLAADQAALQEITQRIAANAGAKDDLSYQIKTFMNPLRIPAGLTRIQPGTGLGCGVDSEDGRPLE